jgi:hypothetical protein
MLQNIWNLVSLLCDSMRRCYFKIQMIADWLHRYAHNLLKLSCFPNFGIFMSKCIALQTCAWEKKLAIGWIQTRYTWFPLCVLFARSGKQHATTWNLASAMAWLSVWRKRQTWNVGVFGLRTGVQEKVCHASCSTAVIPGNFMVCNELQWYGPCGHMFEWNDCMKT